MMATKLALFSDTTTVKKNIDKQKDFEPLVMGILNITPDSFFDGNKFNKIDKCKQQVEKMLEEGAGIIDIGAVSTRPGAKDVSEKEEIERLSSVLKKIRQDYTHVFLSVDTFRSEVAKWAVNEGADMINDISGGTFDNEMLVTIASLNIPYVLMHTQGKPENMQNKPEYDYVTKEIFDFLEKQSNLLKSFGHKKIIIDPGFGFGKTFSNNYEILRNLNSFKKLNLPVLVGMSRKSMINNILGIHATKSINATTAVHTIALLNGADILRVHDVKEAKEAIKIVEFYKT